MAVSINPDSKILGVLDLIKEAGSGVHQNPWDNIRDKVGGLLYNTLVEPQEYQTPVFDTGQTQQFADTHNAMLPEQGSKQSMLLPFGYDAQGNIEPAVPSLARDIGLGAFGLLGEYEKAQTGTGYQDVRDITGQEAANVSQGMLEVMTGGLLDNAPKTFTSGLKRGGNEKDVRGLLDDVDKLGFYSPTERLAANLQPKGTGQQYLGILSKGDGQGSRIQEEMQDMGLDTWLRSKGKVSRDEVLDYIRDNRLRYDLVNDTEYPQYSQKGGTDYQENLLTVPIDSKGLETYKIDDGGVKYYGVRNLEDLDASGNPRRVYVEDYDIMTNTPERALESANKILGRNTNYQSSHYDQANIGLTTRTQSFNTPDGNSVHLMDELQSDWHKEGKTQGYAAPPKTEAEIASLMKEFDELDSVYAVKHNQTPAWQANYDEGGEWGEQTRFYNTEQEALDAMRPQYEETIRRGDDGEFTGTVPNAPAKQSWINQGIKKEINQTIADGKDYFAWTGGKQQIDRYEEAMRQNVDEIIYEVGDDGKYFVDVSKNNSLVYENSGLSIEEVEQIFGKDIAKQIKNNNGEVASKLRPDARTLSGDDLAIGGEGMKSFYDKDVKKRTEKIIKRLDPKAKVEVIELDNGNKVWGVKITDQMRDKVKGEGMPLYSIAPIAGAGLLGAGMMRQEDQQSQQGILN